MLKNWLKSLMHFQAGVVRKGPAGRYFFFVAAADLK